ncbi:MAG: alpha/beta fold hydrolase [Nitrospirota bacterium]|nr:MAG: alpha/beta fold hydrolase [Nitrospirota bacterium]
MFDFENPQFQEIDGRRIAYHRVGSGEPLMLVHGITTYSFIWRRIIPLLEPRYDVIAVDLLGCGDSDKPTGVDYSIKAQADMLVKLMDAIGLDRVHLVTHDIGGGIGQIMVVDHPQRVSDLVLINSVAHDFWPVQPIISMRIPILRQLAMAVLDLGIMKALIRRGIYHKDRVDDELLDLYMRPLRTREGRAGFLLLAKCIDNRLLTSREEKIRGLELPVLIIRGDADPYLGPEISDFLHKMIRGSEIEVVPTGGHFIQEDEPELLSERILRFLDSN